MRGVGGFRLACSVAGLTLPLWYPRGAWRFGCPPILPLAYVLSPIPPTPFPAGRGDFLLSYARGFAPCSPGAESGRHGAGECATRPAGKGILAFLCKGLPPGTPASEPGRHGVGECATRPAGKGILAFLCKGLPPPAPLLLNPGGTGQGSAPRTQRERGFWLSYARGFALASGGKPDSKSIAEAAKPILQHPKSQPP